MSEWLRGFVALSVCAAFAAMPGLALTLVDLIEVERRRR